MKLHENCYIDDIIFGDANVIRRLSYLYDIQQNLSDLKTSLYRAILHMLDTLMVLYLIHPERVNLRRSYVEERKTVWPV